MTQTTSPVRNTQVISISLSPLQYKYLESARKSNGESRSSFIARLVSRYAEDQHWQKIYQKRAVTAGKFKITSEADIDRILHDQQTPGGF